MGRDYLSIPKLQELHRWSLVRDKYFHPTLYNGCNCFSMLRLKLKHVSEKSPCSTENHNPGKWLSIKPTLEIQSKCENCSFKKMYVPCAKYSSCSFYKCINFLNGLPRSILSILPCEIEWRQTKHCSFRPLGVSDRNFQLRRLFWIKHTTLVVILGTKKPVSCHALKSLKLIWSLYVWIDLT